MGDLFVGYLVDKPVAAEHEAVAQREGHHPSVDLHRGLDAEGTGDDVASRVAARLVFGDVAGVDQLLHIAVIDRRPAQAATAIQVGAAVADVGEHQTGWAGG